MYHVMFSNDDVRQMTLDQVDDCFRLGVINEETLLWTEGMIAWETLREAAGLSEPTRNAPAPPRRGNRPPSRRSGRAEPPPRKRSSTARAVSSPEVVTSARPLQASRPAVGQLPPLQPAPLPGQGYHGQGHHEQGHHEQGYQTSRHPSHVVTPTPSQPTPSQAASNRYVYPDQRAPQVSSVVALQQPTPVPSASPQQLYQQQALSQTYRAPHTPSSYPAASPARAVQPAAAPQSMYPPAMNAQRPHAAYAPGGMVSHTAAGSTQAYTAPEYTALGHAAPGYTTPGSTTPGSTTPGSTTPGTAQWGQPSVNPFVQQPMHSAGYWSSPVASAAPAGYVRQNRVSANAPATNSLVPVAASMTPPAFDVSGLDDVPFARGRGSGFARFQRWVFVLSLFGGAAVVAYRNDYLLQVAKSARLERTYLALESKYLGGAPEGTLRALKGVVVDTAGAAANSVWNSSTEVVAPSRNNHGNIELTPPPAVNPGHSELSTARASEADEPKPSAPPVDQSPDTEAAAAKTASSAESTGSSGRAAKSSNVGASYGGVTRTAAPSYSPPSTTKTTAAPSKAFQESLAKYQASKRNKQSDESSSSYAASRNEPAPKPGTEDFLHMNMRQAIKKKSSGDSSAPSTKRRSTKTDYDPLNGDI